MVGIRFVAPIASGQGHRQADRRGGYALAFGQGNRTLSEYIDWAVKPARRMTEIDV